MCVPSRIESSSAPSRSFAAFMQEALYDSRHGYYASGRARIGKQGDFFTNVSVGKIYGKILTLFLEDLWERLGRPPTFSIVEQGAHDGSLALDILEALQDLPELLEASHYYIVEPFSFRQQQQQEKLKDQKKVSWVAQLHELPPFEGIHFSNELVDAFPLHLLFWNGSEWLEQRVSSSAPGHFSWIHSPIVQQELHHVAKQLPRHLPAGFLWEVRLGVQPWLADIFSKMKRGALLVADYGYAGADRFAPYRAAGSIACYRDHQRFDNPLEEIGERDITAHVDFTALAETALKQGWKLMGYSDQHHFLIGAAEQWLRSFQGKEMTDALRRDFRLLHTLLHPETMGRQFQFLGLAKNLETTPALRGFQYQRPGLHALQLAVGS